MIGMMHVFNAMMENTSLGAMSGMGSAIAIMEKMEDYNPILTIDDRGETRLISTDGPGNADFYPGCQLM